MAIAVANSWSSRALAAASLAITVSGINAGELLVVGSYLFDTGANTINAPTDNGSIPNTYTNRSATTWSATFRSINRLADTIVVNAPTTVTINPNASADIAGVVLRVTGNAAASVFDAEATPKTVTGANPASNTLTTANADDLLVSFLTHDGGTTVLTPPSGWNAGPENEDSAGEIFSSGYLVVAATQATTYAWTATSNDYALIVGAYKAAATAAAGGAVLPVRIPNARVGPMALRHLFRRAVWPSGSVATQTFPQPLTATSVVVTASIQKQANTTMAATAVAVSGSMVRQTNKILTAAAVVVTASMQRQVKKVLASAAVAATASLLALKVIVKTMTATGVVTASIQKQVNKPLTASAVAVTATIQKQVGKTLTASAVVVTASLQSLKVILRAMTATAVAVTASIRRQVNKNATATAVAVTASMQRQTNKTLAATAVAASASIQALKVIVRAMTATAVAVTASMQRRISKGLAATSVVVSASMIRQIAKTLTATATVTASMTKLVSKRLAASVTGLASLVATFIAAAASAVIATVRTRSAPGSGVTRAVTGTSLTRATGGNGETQANPASGITGTEGADGDTHTIIGGDA